jgi:hypothetical protein
VLENSHPFRFDAQIHDSKADLNVWKDSGSGCCGSPDETVQSCCPSVAIKTDLDLNGTILFDCFHLCRHWLFLQLTVRVSKSMQHVRERTMMNIVGLIGLTT